MAKKTSNKLETLKKCRKKIASIIKKFDAFEIEDEEFNKKIEAATKLLNKYANVLTKRIEKLEGDE